MQLAEADFPAALTQEGTITATAEMARVAAGHLQGPNAEYWLVDYKLIHPMG
jgi:hypothetical protein